VTRFDERRVVVTGIGPVTPIGTGRENFWQAAMSGRSGTVALESLPFSFDVGALRSRVVARVPASETTAEYRHLALARIAMRLALRDAGVDSLEGEDSAVIMGTAVASTAEMEAAYLKGWNDIGFDGSGRAPLLRTLAFQTMAHELATACQCTGPVLTVATGCTAGIDAIGMAFDMIRSSQADIVLAGASEAPITPVVFAAFDAIGALTKRNDCPGTASRPFDSQRDGFVLGEGAACLIIEERNRALARNAPIYAEIKGFASLSNGYHMTDLPAHGQALADCMRQAMADARLEPAQIDFVCAHGSSTPQNDLCETNALKSALGQRAYRVPMTSLKSMMGHALGASNAIEIAGCALTLQEQYIPPTINFDSPGVGCDLDYVPNTGRAARVRNLLKLSSGFSGIHSVLAMGTA